MFEIAVAVAEETRPWFKRDGSFLFALLFSEWPCRNEGVERFRYKRDRLSEVHRSFIDAGPSTALPAFPVQVGGVGEFLAAFLTESRTRGCWRVPRSRKSGCAPVGMTILWDHLQPFVSRPSLRLKPSSLWLFTARLESCPDTKHHSRDYRALCSHPLLGAGFRGA
jgi:hypothetical protein